MIWKGRVTSEPKNVCPKCGSSGVKVMDSRPVAPYRRRKYRCPQGHEYETVEMLINQYRQLQDKKRRKLKRATL